MKATLIYNPFSRNAVGKFQLDEITSHLEQVGIAVHIPDVHHTGDIRRLAAKAAGSGGEVVICAGGDGTIHEVINGIAGTSARLGIIPIGTANVLASELAIPRDPRDACRVIARSRVRPIDLCKCNDSFFSCMAGVGFDAQVVQEINPQLKELFGVFAYYLSAIRALVNFDLPELQIKLDAHLRKIKGYCVVICNSRYYGGRYMICPNAAIDDGFLDLCVLRKKDIATILRSSLSMLLDHFPANMGLQYYRARRVTIQSNPRAPVQADGDIVAKTPVSIRVVPKALKVMVPHGDG